MRFFEHLSDRFAGNRRREAALYDFVREELEGPPRLPLGRRRTRHGNEVRFLFASQFPLRPRSWELVECAKAGLDKPLARAEDRGCPHISRGSNGSIAQPIRRFQQNPGARQFACACLAATKHVF